MSTETDKIRANAVDSTAQADAIDEQQSGDNQGAIDELEGVAIPALQTATTSVQAALDMLKKKPEPPVDEISVAPTGTPEDAGIFLDAIGQALETGGTIHSEPGEWDLSEVTPKGITGRLAWRGQSLWNFGYKHLGAMFSLGSGSSLDLDGVSAKGYDRCLFYASEDYSKVPYSGGRLDSWGFDNDGAPAIMETGWIEHVEIKNGFFEGPLFLMQTGPWWETFKTNPNGPYPGLRSARFENVSWDGYGGIHIGVYKHGDIVFKGCKGRSQNTKEFLVPFYEKFGKTANPEKFLMSQTGQAIQPFLSAFNVGRAEHFAAENGTVTVEDCSTDLFVNDRTPSENKYTIDQEWHAVQSRSAKMLYVRDCDFVGGFDLSYIHEPWARSAVNGYMGCECIYTKGDVLIERVKATNWGPGEGALIACKPGGGKVLDCEVVNDKNLIPEPYRSRLAEFSLVHWKNDPNSFIKTRPDDTAEPQLAMLALHTNERLSGTLSEISGLIVRGCIEPPGGWENLVRRWGPHQTKATGVKAYDLAGTLLWPN